MKPRHDGRLSSGLPNSLMYFLVPIASTLENNIKHDLLLMSTNDRHLLGRKSVHSKIFCKPDTCFLGSQLPISLLPLFQDSNTKGRDQTLSCLRNQLKQLVLWETA